MRLKNKTSHIHNLSEGTPPRRILPAILKYFYFLILLAIIAGVVYLVALKYLFFSGFGQVETSKIILSSKHGGTVKALEKQPGMKFSTGEVLAVIDRGRDCLEQVPDIRLTRLAYEIKSKQEEYNIFTKQLGLAKKGYSSGILPRALEIGDTAPQRKAEELQREYDRIRATALQLAAEIAIKKQELAALEVEMAPKPDITCEFETINAPFDGTIYYITHMPDEYVDQGESLLVVVPEQADVHIEAYFDNESLRYITKGRTLDITFPDGSVSTGIVTAISSSAQYSPETKREKYVPVEALLRINLQPPTKSEESYWRSYDRMHLKVEGRRQ